MFEVAILFTVCTSIDTHTLQLLGQWHIGQWWSSVTRCWWSTTHTS